MSQLLSILHVILAVLMIFGILIQHRASGLSATFGGSGSTVAVQKRGAEKAIYQFTVWVSVAFFVLALLRWYV